MESFSLVCKGCGAPLKAEASAHTLKCEYCGAELMIRPPTRAEPVHVELVKPPRAPHPAPPPRYPAPPPDTRAIRQAASFLDAFLGIRSCLNTAVGLTITFAFLALFLLMCLCVLPNLNRGNLPQGRTDKMNEAAQERETKSRLSLAKGVVESYAKSNHRLPDDDEGQPLIAQYQDAWSHDLRYEQNDRNSFVIRSSGPDGQWNNGDDVTERGYLSPTVVSASKDDPPADTQQALAFLNSPGQHRKRLALSWLIETKPAASEQNRSQIVRAVFPLLADRTFKDQARRVLREWITAGDAPLLVAAAQDTTDGEYAKLLIELLGRLRDAASLLTLINHPDTSVRDTATNTARLLNVDDGSIVRQSLADLDDPKRCLPALARLDQMSIDASLRGDVAEAVDRLLQGEVSLQIGNEAIKLLQKYATPESVPTLIHLYEENIFLRDEAQALLVQHPATQTLSHFSDRLREPRSTSLARELLMKMGPVAESYVWPVLGDASSSVRIAACEILTEIGTWKSVAHLEPLLEDRILGSRVKAALESIRSSNREPVDPPSGNAETGAT